LSCGTHISRSISERVIKSIWTEKRYPPRSFSGISSKPKRQERKKLVRLNGVIADDVSFRCCHCAPLRAATLVCAPEPVTESIAARPNILWFIAEDLGPKLGSYGHPEVRTLNLDRSKMLRM
jgi:hypothetical protein